MISDPILKIEIDSRSRLLIYPKFKTFPHIYREAMSVNWDPVGNFLYSPVPRDLTHVQWYSHILAAAYDQGVDLKLTPETQWVNVIGEVRKKIEALPPWPKR